MKKRPLFITFEGLEGCGKTTQAELLKGFLERMGYSTVLTREPGGTPIAEELRGMLLGHKGEALSPWAELLLYLACRAEVVEKVIRPALERGRIVICDRFSDSTIAYQGYGQGMPLEAIYALDGWVTGGLKPDITFLLDIHPEKGLERARKRGTEDRFERKEMDFHRRVREGYMELASKESRIRVLDGGRGASSIHREICDIIKSILMEE